MKKLLCKSFIVLIFSALIAGGCKKKEDTPPPTKTELITKSAWKFSKAVAGGTDVSALLQLCQRDNIATFASNGTGTNDEGPAKCSPADPQTTNFTWSFQSNETALFISTPLFTGGSSTFTIVSLSETEMVLSQTITVLGSPQTVIVTFIH